MTFPWESYAEVTACCLPGWLSALCQMISPAANAWVAMTDNIKLVRKRTDGNWRRAASLCRNMATIALYFMIVSPVAFVIMIFMALTMASPCSRNYPARRRSGGNLNRNRCNNPGPSGSCLGCIEGRNHPNLHIDHKRKSQQEHHHLTFGPGG